MNKLVLLFFSFFFVACHPVKLPKKDIIFQYSDKEFGATQTLTLRSDQTFEFTASVGLLLGESKGKWF